MNVDCLCVARRRLGLMIVLMLVVSAAAPAARAEQKKPPRPDHVVIVIEENRSYNNIIGNPQAPYLNHLAQVGANFSRSFAIEHPSQPNYLDLFAGGNQGVHSDGRPDGLPFSTPNLGAQLLKAGFSFAGYSEDLPAIGFVGNAHSTRIFHHQYVRKHNPWVNWQDPRLPTPTNRLPPSVNLPLTHWPSDFSQLPTVAFVIPNEDNDMHDGSIHRGDVWLQHHLRAYEKWARGHNSLLIVTFDEDDGSMSNQIPTLFVGPMVRPGKVGRRIDHFDVLRTLEDMYGLPYAGRAAGAGTITRCFR